MRGLLSRRSLPSISSWLLGDGVEASTGFSAISSLALAIVTDRLLIIADESVVEG
ncbi:hypothetical protein [Novipirellula artificiosorum]|uniref:hypothetical protein n=1 Tax=Novipirellula artificiosorum TaxID=2528016 RepID=UPI0018CD7944|nr:hypothetical protein [Novipirellula artificiosorum]